MKGSRFVLCTVFTIVLSIFTSQCFAQSASKTASKDSNDIRQYIEYIYSVFNFVEKNYVDDVEPKVLFEGAMKGLFDSLGDPFSYYMDEASFNSMSETTTGNFGGVGLQITKQINSTKEKPAYVEVVAAIEDTPGAKAGIQTGDLIIDIDGTDTSTITMNDVLKLLRGDIGTTVNIVVRRGENMELPFTLKRALIEVQTVKSTMIGSTGYMRIIEFTPQTADRVQEALDSFKKSKYDSLIIDLRNNPGGLLSSAVDIADKFIDNGPIVSTKSRLAKENQVYFASAKKTKIPKNLPVVVLIDHNSASCSEVLSGALKDAHVAYLMGEQSYGKGSVQIVVPLPPEKIGIRLTIAKYYSPSDSNIHGIGIAPDYEIKNIDISKEEEETFQNLVKDNVILPYVTEHPNMDEKDISKYADSLYEKYPIDKKFLRRIIRIQAYRTKDFPLYDEDYDDVLTKALEVVRDKNFATIIKNTKSLKELENERNAKKEAETQE